MRKIFLLGILALLTLSTFAQSGNEDSARMKMDSIRNFHLGQAALRYPILRQATVSSDIIFRGAVRSKLYDQDFYQSRLQTNRIRGNFNIPVAKLGKNLISSSVGVLYQQMNLDNSINSPLSGDGKTMDITTLSLQLAVSRSDSLFNRPVIYNVGVTALTNASFSQSRFIVTGLVSFSLRRTATTSLSVGALFAIDPSSPSPVVPFVSYFHRFNALHLELYADFPSRVVVRRPLSPKSALSLGSNLGGNLAFFNINQVSVPQDAMHTVLELKTGILYEYRISPKMVLGMNAGMFSILRSKLLDSKGDASDAFIENKNSSVPYVNLSVSFLPFWKGFVK